jgi:hypothetical protein
VEEEGATTSANAVAAMPENSSPGTTDARPSIETNAIAPEIEAPVGSEAAPQLETPAPKAVVNAPDAAAPVAAAQPPSLAATMMPAAPNAETVSDKRQRVSVAATPATLRHPADDGVRRAEKLRRASNVVLDEAAADPSLRFVLVATALIIISIVLLLLARVL